MKKYSYEQISKITGKKIGNIRSLAHKLNVNRTLIKGTTYINQEGLEIIEAHFLPRAPRVNNKNKIRIVERYFQNSNYRSVAKTCSLPRQYVKTVILEWEQSGHITVDSSINFPEKIQKKGVFKKGVNWGYCFVKNGTKYYKSGFEDELRAVEELTRLKENLNNQN